MTSEHVERPAELQNGTEDATETCKEVLESLGTKIGNVKDDLFERKEKIIGSFKGVNQDMTNSGNNMLMALDVNTEGTTIEVFKAHLYRIFLTILLFIYMQFLGFWDQIEEAEEILQQMWFLIKMNAKLEARSSKNSIGIVKRWVDYTSYLHQLVVGLPASAYSFVFNNLLCYTPSGMKSFQESIPPEVLPKSLALILRYNENVVPPPPQIPQPYLDADKKIVVPGQKEVSSVLALRNEYFTQQRAHIAAEKVRMLSELGRLVTWSCLAGSIHFVDIYERFGLLWNDGKSDIEQQLEVIGSTILNELSAFINSCRKNEMSAVNNTVPRVVLIEVSSGIKHTLKDPFLDEQAMIPPDGSISPYEERREMLVYLSDYKLKEESLVELAVKTVDNPESLETNLSTYLPPTPDLVMVPDKDNRKNIILDGFASAGRNEADAKSSLIYRKNQRFGYKFFTRSLFFYSVINEDSFFKISFEESTNTSNRSLFSLVTQSPSHYASKVFSYLPKINLFKRSTQEDTQESPLHESPQPEVVNEESE